MRLSFEAVREERPGPRWAGLFEALWPDFQRWFLAEGDGARPGFLECERALGEHMPELLPTWRALVELAGGSDAQARFLSLYCPPPYLTGCSQAAWSRGGPLLIRNYDYHPALSERKILRTAWNGRGVIASSDCLIGALDGLNEAGLAVSLSFGGRRETGRGFGAPLVLRYLLEFCSSVEEASEVLRRVPTHMAYNILAVDRSGRCVTAFTGPGEPGALRETPVSTNHQDGISWERHARATSTLEREQHLLALLADGSRSRETVAEEFLRPPLHSTDYDRGFGTLYTAAYDPARGEARFLWPGASWEQSLAVFEEGSRTVDLPEGRDAGI